MKLSSFSGAVASCVIVVLLAAPGTTNAFTPASPKASVVGSDQKQKQHQKQLVQPQQTQKKQQQQQMSPLFRKESKLRMTEITSVLVPGFLMISSMVLSIASARQGKTVVEVLRDSLSEPPPLDVVEEKGQVGGQLSTSSPPPIPEIDVVSVKTIDPSEPELAPAVASTTTTEDGAADTEKEEMTQDKQSQADEQLRMARLKLEAAVAKRKAAEAELNAAEAKRKTPEVAPSSPAPIFPVRFLRWLWRAFQKIVAPWRPWRNISP